MGRDPAKVRAVARIPLNGVATAVRFYTFDGLSKSDHFAIRFGNPSEAPLVRIHSECVTGDVFGSLRCDCGSQLQQAIRKLDDESGWLVYLRQEGRGIGLAAKLDTYVLQEGGMDTFAANLRLGYAEDERDYSDAARMLVLLGVLRLRLLTGNPDKAAALRQAGLIVESTVPCVGQETSLNSAYLAAKRARSHAVRE